MAKDLAELDLTKKIKTYNKRVIGDLSAKSTRRDKEGLLISEDGLEMKARTQVLNKQLATVFNKGKDATCIMVGYQTEMRIWL